jgi:hypothetical protein
MMTRRQLQNRMRTHMVHDYRLRTKESRKMMLPIYGRTMHCYQMDTLEQSDEAKRKGN